MVLATQYRVFSLEADSGRPRWEYGRRPAALDNPGADPEDFAVFVSMALADRLLVALRSDGTAVALQVESGRPKWEHHLDHRPAGPVGMNDTWIVYQTARLGQPACAVLAAADGKPVQVIRPEDDRQVTHIFVTLDGRVVLVTSETVQCHDVATGQRVWSVQRPQGIMAGGVAPDLDGLCLADANLQTEKLELASGRTVWRADSPGERVRPGAEGIAFHLCDGQLVVATERRVFALSQRDGRVLWEGTVRRGTRFRRHLMTDSFLVAVDSPPEHFGEPRAAFFYDLRNASGLIPTDGGVLTLGTFEDVKRVTVRDGALLLQDSRTIHAWTTEP